MQVRLIDQNIFLLEFYSVWVIGGGVLIQIITITTLITFTTLWIVKSQKRWLLRKSIEVVGLIYNFNSKYFYDKTYRFTKKRTKTELWPRGPSLWPSILRNLLPGFETMKFFLISFMSVLNNSTHLQLGVNFLYLWIFCTLGRDKHLGIDKYLGFEKTEPFNLVSAHLHFIIFLYP